MIEKNMCQKDVRAVNSKDDLESDEGQNTSSMEKAAQCASEAVSPSIRPDMQGASSFAGVFLIDKPAGPSSFGVVRDVRRLLGIKKVGHAGTLDPFASGLLVICVGRAATKLISKFMDGDKEYIATMRLGIETSTQDVEGEITAIKKLNGSVQSADIQRCLSSFIGEQEQTPPSFSALKHKGKPLYHYARQGIHIVKPARQIRINDIKWLNRDVDLNQDIVDVTFRVSCSKGTYIRSLASDMGKMLGCGAHLVGLRRTRSGIFHVDHAFCGKELKNKDCRDRFKESTILIGDALTLLE